MVADDVNFMHLALAEGRKALPGCLPNPPVGCVLTEGGVVVARGHTGRPGEHHAESLALSLLPAARLPEVTAYVTLEPCSFHGRTPSCARALVNREVSRVVVAVLDPDVRNNGAGIAILREGGVEVELGVCGREALRDLAPYLALAANNSLNPTGFSAGSPKPAA